MARQDRAVPDSGARSNLYDDITNIIIGLDIQFQNTSVLETIAETAKSQFKLRRHGFPAFPRPTVIGIDDWAWRRNQRYGTIVCDLERRRPISLLPDREPATAQAWLSEQPQITIVARDRGGAYSLAVSKALPHAVQVADRWHLMKNASRAFLDAVRKSMRHIRTAIGTATINPELLTAAERIQYEGYQRREETNAAVLALAKDNVGIKEIVRRTGHSRGLVRQILRGQRDDVFNRMFIAEQRECV